MLSQPGRLILFCPRDVSSSTLIGWRVFNSAADGVLAIRGKKQEQKEEKKKDYYLSERSCGSFQCSFQVPDGVDTDKIEATFKNGVLTVTMPKSAEAQKSAKKITAKAA